MVMRARWGWGVVVKVFAKLFTKGFVVGWMLRGGEVRGRRRGRMRVGRMDMLVCCGVDGGDGVIYGGD